MARLVWVVAVLACSTIVADELKWVDAIAEKAFSSLPSTKTLETDLKVAELQLRSAKAAKVVRGGENRISPMISPMPWYRYEQFSTKEEKESAIAESEKLIAIRRGYVKDGVKIQPPALDNDEPKVRDAGTIQDDRLRVIQVINSNTAIVEIASYKNVFRSEQGVPVLKSRKHTTQVWFRDNTAGWSDGATIDYKKPILFVGTRQYKTVDGGSKTLLVARPWTEPELQRFREWKPMAGVKHE